MYEIMVELLEVENFSFVIVRTDRMALIEDMLPNVHKKYGKHAKISVNFVG